MNRTVTARLLRFLLVAGGTGSVILLVMTLEVAVPDSPQLRVLLPFVAAALAVVALDLVLPRLNRLVERLTGSREVTAYSALAEAAARIGAGSPEQALPGIAEVLAGGTGATRAVVWLVVGDRLIEAAHHPPGAPRAPVEVANLAVLLARADTDHVVPVLDGPVLRAALTIEKRDQPVTPADHRLMQDVANGAGLLLRGVAQNAELSERVRRADGLARELQASRQRLASAREVERRRLVMELSHVTSNRLATLRTEVAAARLALGAPPGADTETLDIREPDAGAPTSGTGTPASGTHAAVQQAVARASAGLDDLLDRFRVIARGVYPAVLRDLGPAAALEEVAADLVRPVRISGGLAGRLDWEIESGIYYVAAAAVHELAGCPADGELLLSLEQAAGRVGVVVDDPTPPVSPEQLLTALVDDVERLTALGGGVELVRPAAVEASTGTAVRLRAWLPEQLEPLIASGAGAEPRV